MCFIVRTLFRLHEQRVVNICIEAREVRLCFYSSDVEILLTNHVSRSSLQFPGLDAFCFDLA